MDQRRQAHDRDPQQPYSRDVRRAWLMYLRGFIRFIRLIRTVTVADPLAGLNSLIRLVSYNRLRGGIACGILIF